jgi:hypothetical protein
MILTKDNFPQSINATSKSIIELQCCMNIKWKSTHYFKSEASIKTKHNIGNSQSKPNHNVYNVYLGNSNGKTIFKWGLVSLFSVIFGTKISWLSMPLSPLAKKIPIENDSEGGNRESWAVREGQ